MLVIPKVGGITIFSPKLDRLRNSIRGVEFCDQLTDIYRFHKYDSVHTGENISAYNTVAGRILDKIVVSTFNKNWAGLG